MTPLEAELAVAYCRMARVAVGRALELETDITRRHELNHQIGELQRHEKAYRRIIARANAH